MEQIVTIYYFTVNLFGSYGNITSWWGVVWVSPKSVVNLFLWWKDCKMRKEKRLTWDATPSVDHLELKK